MHDFAGPANVAARVSRPLDTRFPVGIEDRTKGGRSKFMVELHSTITCPLCGATATETMPTDFCLYFYDCPGCAAVLKALAGDCCVFCSYGDVKCPPIQEGQSCCEK
jgi:hypothetical protein